MSLLEDTTELDELLRQSYENQESDQQDNDNWRHNNKAENANGLDVPEVDDMGFNTQHDLAMGRPWDDGGDFPLHSGLNAQGLPFEDSAEYAGGVDEGCEDDENGPGVINDSDEEEEELIRQTEQHYLWLLRMQSTEEKESDAAIGDTAMKSLGQGHDSNERAFAMNRQFPFGADEANDTIMRSFMLRQQRGIVNDMDVSTLEEFMASFKAVEYKGDPSDPLDMDQAEFRKKFFSDQTWYCQFEKMLCELVTDVIQPHDPALVRPEHLKAIISARDEFACILPLTMPTEVSAPVMACNFVGRECCVRLNEHVETDNPFQDIDIGALPIPRAKLAALTWADHSPEENQSGPTKIISENPHATIIVFRKNKATLWGLRSHEAEMAASMAAFYVLAKETGVVCVPYALSNTNQQLSGMFEFSRRLEKLGFLCPYVVMDDKKIANARILRPGLKKKFMSLWGTDRFGVYGVTETRHQISAIRFLIKYIRECCIDPVESKRLLHITTDGKSPLVNSVDRRRWRVPGPNGKQRFNRRVQALKKPDHLKDNSRGRRRGRGRGRGRGGDRDVI
jgi:hypothetical protein